MYNPFEFTQTNQGFSNPIDTSQLHVKPGTPNIQSVASNQSTPDVRNGDQLGQIAGYAGNALNAYAMGRSESQGVDIDTSAGFKGALQGFAQGGWVGSVIGGVAGQIGAFSGLNKNLRQITSNVDALQYDAYGNPVYNSQAVIGAGNTISDINKTKRKLNNSWDPTTRIFSGIFGSQRKLRRARERLRKGIAGGQTNFNAANLANEQASQSQAAYQQAQNELFQNPGYPFGFNTY